MLPENIDIWVDRFDDDLGLILSSFLAELRELRAHTGETGRQMEQHYRIGRRLVANMGPVDGPLLRLGGPVANTSRPAWANRMPPGPQEYTANPGADEYKANMNAVYGRHLRWWQFLARWRFRRAGAAVAPAAVTPAMWVALDERLGAIEANVRALAEPEFNRLILEPGAREDAGQ